MSSLLLQRSLWLQMPPSLGSLPASSAAPLVLEQWGPFSTVKKHRSLFAHFGRNGFRAGTGPWFQSLGLVNICPAGQTDSERARASGRLPDLGHVGLGPQGH